MNFTLEYDIFLPELSVVLTEYPSCINFDIAWLSPLVDAIYKAKMKIS